jgi:hypothetical protein
MAKTNLCLPKTLIAKFCLDYRFQFTIIENHWSNLKTCKQFIRHILIPYFENEMNLKRSQKMIWLIDCWFIHKLNAFFSWMKEEYPYRLKPIVKAFIK